jgi:signal transduction histidine kinase
MKERAALLGGTFAVESSPGGGGTTVFVRIPLGGPESDPTGAE